MISENLPKINYNNKEINIEYMENIKMKKNFKTLPHPFSRMGIFVDFCVFFYIEMELGLLSRFFFNVVLNHQRTYAIYETLLLKQQLDV